MPYNNFCNDMVSPLYVSLNGLWDYYLLRKPYHTDFTYIVSSQHVISNALWDNNLLRKPYHIGCIGIVSLLCVTNMFYKLCYNDRIGMIHPHCGVSYKR